jgi:hypothetical protein
MNSEKRIWVIERTGFDSDAICGSEDKGLMKFQCELLNLVSEYDDYKVVPYNEKKHKDIF